MNNYVLQQPSLQQMAEVKIVRQLWNREDVKTEIARFRFTGDKESNFDEDFRSRIEIKVREKTWAIHTLPNKLKKNVESMVSPLGLEIWKFYVYHHSMNRTLHGVKNLDQLCWTPRGTVDYEKTAQLIVRDETNADIGKRYKMACMYCFESDILTLWQRMTKKRQLGFWRFHSGSLRDWQPFPNFGNLNDLLTFWTCALNNKDYLEIALRKMRQLTFDNIGGNLSYQFALDSALIGGNKSAINFVLKQLLLLSSDGADSYRPSMQSCVGLLLRSSITEVASFQTEALFFLLNRMNAEEEEQVFAYYTFEVLRCMLCWPCQSLFAETANKWLRFLHPFDCTNLLNLILKKMERDEDYSICKELFGEFWQLTFRTYTAWFLDSAGLRIIIKLYECKEVELVKYVISQMTDVQKSKLIYAKDKYRHLMELIDMEKWDFLAFLMKEGLVSKEILSTFKTSVEVQQQQQHWTAAAGVENSESRRKLTKALQFVHDFIEHLVKP